MYCSRKLNCLSGKLLSQDLKQALTPHICNAHFYVFQKNKRQYFDLLLKSQGAYLELAFPGLTLLLLSHLIVQMVAQMVTAVLHASTRALRTQWIAHFTVSSFWVTIVDLYEVYALYSVHLHSLHSAIDLLKGTHWHLDSGTHYRLVEEAAEDDSWPRRHKLSSQIRSLLFFLLLKLFFCIASKISFSCSSCSTLQRTHSLVPVSVGLRCLCHFLATWAKLGLFSSDCKVAVRSGRLT